MKHSITFIFLLAALRATSQNTMDSLDIKIGQMIMGGVRDYYDFAIRRELFEDLSSGKLGGIILFEKNILPVDSKKELANMIVESQTKAAYPLLVAIDEEGGKVNRLKPKYGFHKPPSAQKLGETDNLDSTQYYSEKTAKNLHELGININFAPSVDVNINPNSPAIGTIGRSFSKDHQKVTAHARAYIEGHDRYGIGTALKHFPGHGSSEDDTHLGVADVSDTWQIEEIYPYMDLIDSGRARAIMTSHVVNRSLDEKKLPGTLSYKIVTGLLRHRLGYEGVVFSDDMQMKAIVDNYGLETAIEMSVNAGVDVLIFANNVPNHHVVTVSQVFDIIKRLVAEGIISRARIAESYTRIMALKAHLGLNEPGYVKQLKKRIKALY